MIDHPHHKPAKRLLETFSGFAFDSRDHFYHHFRKDPVMFSIIVGQTINCVLTPVCDAADDPGQLQAGTPPTYPVDTLGIVTITPAPDGLSAVFTGAVAGVCNITPTAIASNGQTIVGPVIQITVALPPPPPIPPATVLLETISVGPVP
jgi:hypothetical protein